MSKRLDQDKQKVLEPQRMDYAVEKLAELGIIATRLTNSELEFEWKGNVIKLFPYSGWHTGKGIKDGRGIDKLLKQLK
jgi:hypothetical protein